jgi:HK97 family phage prohead protease/HK97 family phage major capsid protein
MPMKPHKGESQSDFMKRCVPEMIGTGSDKRPQEQAVAICMELWRNKDKQDDDDNGDDLDLPDPDPDENYDDFMDRCTDAASDLDMSDDDAENACDAQWQSSDNAASYAAGRGLTHFKTHASDVQGMEFVLSDETPDRMDDVIMSDGWDLENFKKNPIALFGHRSDFPIGKWRNLHVENKQLKGHLQLAPKGTSPRIDEIRALVDADILRSVSVGFKPVDSTPRKETKYGTTFTKCELVETSLVSVPANPNALAVAKSLNVSTATLSMVFGEHASGIVQRDYRANRGEHADTKRDAKGKTTTGEHAEAKPNSGKGQPMLLSQRIQEAEKGLIALQEQLDKHLETVDDANPTEDQMVVTEDLTAKIEARQRNLTNLKTIEAKNATSAEDPTGLAAKRGQLVKMPSNIVLRQKKLEPLDYFFRSAVIAGKAKVDGRSIDDTRRKLYGDDEATKVISDIILKAASAPAETTVPGWAQELVVTIWAAFMEVLLPMSVYPKLSAKGLAMTFGANGKIVIPTRSLTPSIAGSFVGEGQPIPVRQGAFSSQSLVPKKMAVITTWTREMDEHSTPAIEGLLRQAIMEDTAIAIDTVLLDNNPATAIRPAGLRSYQTGLTPAALTSPFANFVADYAALFGELLTLTHGNVRNPTIILNPIDTLNLSMIQPPNAATSLFPFLEMVDGGRVLKAAVIESSTQTPGMAIMVDAADFTTAGQEGPRLEISDQATLHMEDTAPADIVGGPSGTPVPAWPTKSMWQTDSLALRLIMMTNWIMRRPVATWMTGITWK